MSRKTLDDFQSSFYGAIKAAHRTGKVTFNLPRREAEALRANFYHFRRVLREHEDVLSPMADALKFSVDGKGLHIYPKGLSIPQAGDSSPES